MPSVLSLPGMGWSSGWGQPAEESTLVTRVKQEKLKQKVLVRFRGRIKMPWVSASTGTKMNCAKPWPFTTCQSHLPFFLGPFFPLHFSPFHLSIQSLLAASLWHGAQRREFLRFMPLKCSLLRLSCRLLYLSWSNSATCRFQRRAKTSGRYKSPRWLILHVWILAPHAQEIEFKVGTSTSTGPILAIVFFATGAANRCLSWYHERKLFSMSFKWPEPRQTQLLFLILPAHVHKKDAPEMTAQARTQTNTTQRHHHSMQILCLHLTATKNRDGHATFFCMYCGVHVSRILSTVCIQWCAWPHPKPFFFLRGATTTYSLRGELPPARAAHSSPEKHQKQ